ncbi:secondary thiamine-phosphate synthase enzyme YjbQ [Aureimonas phyllosphaerae]|uniref:Secondary thiamine-phosphate synthase enzyme n=1 Tax=Aureimonas phyllosphaerae TaxID=1166078 RepID=A0A7W6BMV0_9HYPH|nr:secondary thiamine-phosphate synthase enzyme YjbQ [Aureimonas phyllosphaerae]MBB3934898.1 secondary thiamine-phosphate synthase enzyme [Aureimonas phyllosphaerae]MBB3958906.1 secondary thiamine-phosphate synthase enzyme [Aureimonas phyllosphaerae]SFF40862.1 secondary thiamine-phosphate synthase enzyme [Aureimonas phyllosphaerae]
MQPVTQQFLHRLSVQTRGQSLTDISREITAALSTHGAGDGLVTVFIRHTSASLTIQENADPDVRTDLLSAFDRMAPEDAPYVHTLEGPDDMPAHIKTALTDTSIAIPVERGRMVLGTWQGVYLFEHRARPHRREIVLHFIGGSKEP